MQGRGKGEFLYEVVGVGLFTKKTFERRPKFVAGAGSVDLWGNVSWRF